ncbi:MAG: hypothetical protein ACREBA_00490 [Nitrosotalea sp.]
MESDEKAVDQVIRQLVKTVIELKREIAFVPEYAQKARESEILGIILAQYFRWSGRQVAETAYAGLEEANFHKESHRFNEIWQANNPDQADLWINEEEA